MADQTDAKVGQYPDPRDTATKMKADAHVSVSEASRRGYASRSTIQRALKSGKISMSQVSGSEHLLQVSELERAFKGASTDTAVRNRSVTQSKDSKNMPLSAQVELLRQERDKLQTDLAREREQATERETWLKGQVEATQRQLTDERGRSWWQRTFGGSK
jgi:hypothetical protein